MEAVALIEIISLNYPLRLHGTVGEHQWKMFAIADTWVFYVEDPNFGGPCGDYLWWLTGQMPCADQMPQPLAIKIADACAKKFAKLSSTEDPPLQ